MANSKRHSKAKRAARATKAGYKAALVAIGAPTPYSPEHTIHVRELFWNNVIREVLTALSAMSAASSRPGKEGAGNPALDGRMAIITAAGQRVPIADVYPLFACGIPGNADEKALSIAVECTVFQVVTPAGAVSPIPLHEIRGFHALSPELMRQLAESAQAEEPTGSAEPFGFAA